MSSGSRDSGYLRVESTAVPNVSEVRLYSDVWEHIRQRHPEVDAIGKEGVLQTVQSPSRVYLSNTDPDRGYVFASSDLKYIDHPLLVPVKTVEGTSGRVVTAYFSRNPYAGDLIWERDDDT